MQYREVKSEKSQEINRHKVWVEKSPLYVIQVP